MSRLSDRCKKIVSLGMDLYGLDCFLEDKNGTLIPFRAIRRSPQSSELDNATVFVFPFLISGTTFSVLQSKMGYSDAFFYGETIICEGERYKLDWRTPYIADDGMSAAIRLLTTKEA